MTRILIYGFLIVIVLGAAAAKGYELGEKKLWDYQAKQATESARIAIAREKIVTVTQTVYSEKIRTIRVAGETIVKEVPVYVTKSDDADCAIHAGFVRQFNAAWSGVPPGPPAESDRQPSGIPISEVATADATNAAACLTYKTQRDGLIEFYKKQQGVK